MLTRPIVKVGNEQIADNQIPLHGEQVAQHSSQRLYTIIKQPLVPHGIKSTAFRGDYYKVFTETLLAYAALGGQPTPTEREPDTVRRPGGIPRSPYMAATSVHDERGIMVSPW